MEKYRKLKESLEKELLSWEGHQDWTMEALQAVKATASALDHLCNLMKAEMEEEGGNYGRRYMDGGYNRARDSRGRYMDGGDGYNRQYRDGYGHDHDVDALKRKIEELERRMR